MVNLGIIPKAPKILLPKPNGHWQFPVEMGKGKVGFIYCIRDLVLKRGYIGKKSYRVGGQVNKGQETLWKFYKSSSTTMAQIMARRPAEEFEYICIEEYETKSGLSYAETWSLCQVEAPTTPLWYNTRIEKVAWNVRENITLQHKARLEMVQDWSNVGEDSST